MTDEKKLDPERLEIAADVMKALVRMLKGEQDTCLHCGAKIGQLYQNGDCVYADPCGCRQYQGTLPKKENE
jgi:hypothetical protein